MSKAQSRIALLKLLPAFADSSDEALGELAALLTERSVPEGKLIIERGSEADELFILVGGKVEVFLREEAIDLEKILHIPEKGELFGEIALLTGGLRTASVRATSDAQLLVLQQEDFWELLQKSRTAAVSLCRMLGRHLESAFRAEPPIPFVKLEDYPAAAAHRHLLPAKISDLMRAVCIAHDGEIVKVAMVDPFDPDTRRFIGQVLDPLRPEFTAISDSDYRDFFRRHEHEKIDLSGGDGVPAVISYLSPSGTESPLANDSEIDGIIVEAFRTALKSGASDIHFEPRRGRFQVRVRIDGNLVQLREDIDPGHSTKIVSRLKIMADLDVTSHRAALDGGFALRYREREIDARLSTTPSIHGEKAVIRLIDDDANSSDLPSIVTCKPAAMVISELFQQPSGLVLVTGPTGGGKTTTLYAGLKEIWERSDVKNIVTIEDPVDYRLDCATQIQVGADGAADFQTILRSVLRQDPDILLIGEIRDEASATIAHEAALTGHLVLSSVHSHFAVDVIARLKTLGVAPYLIGSALKGIISQRLIPSLCPACAITIQHPDEIEELGMLVRQQVLEKQDLLSGSLKRSNGCELCHMTGLKGRVALFEVLTIRGEIRNLIENDAPVSKICEHLDDGWFLPMRQYARYLLLTGLVDPVSVLAAFPSPPAGPEQVRRQRM